jgi:hypothetical protein
VGGFDDFGAITVDGMVRIYSDKALICLNTLPSRVEVGDNKVVLGMLFKEKE